MVTTKKKFLITKDYQGYRLDKFIAKNILNFPLAQKLIRKKLIKVNRQVISAAYRLNIGDQIEIFTDLNFKEQKNFKKTKKIDPKKIEKIKKTIIFKDKNLIAINKPSGLAVQGGSNITFSVDDSLPYLKFGEEENPRLVHRLDKDTSGILLIARNRISSDFLVQAFKKKKIQKTYLAIVKAIPTKKEGIINIPIIKKYQGKNEKVYKDDKLGKEAITHYKLLKSYKKLNCSLVELRPITGRTHQLRVHLKEIGHPIIGDYKYGYTSTSTIKTKHFLEKRLHLHAFKIFIADFFGKKLEIITKIPDFINL